MLAKRIRLTTEYLLGREKTGGYPSVIGIETTSRCNLECIMCPRQEMTRSEGDMDIELFRRIIDDIKGKVEFVWLQDYGEPFLNRNIFEMIRYAKEQGLRTGISTNATVLTGDTVRSVFDSGLDYIIFAFDGATKQTYEKIRKGADYERVIKNIKHFLDKKARERAKIFTVIQCIHMEETENEIDDFIAQWKLSGVDGIRIRQVTYSGNRGKFKNRTNARPCYWLWSDPHIKWDGTVVPCCQDVNAAYPLGNIKEASLGELWNTEKMVRLRKMHVSGMGRETSLCKECNMYQPGTPLILGSTFLGYFMVNKLVPRVETLISKVRHSF